MIHRVCQEMIYKNPVEGIGRPIPVRKMKTFPGYLFWQKNNKNWQKKDPYPTKAEYGFTYILYKVLAEYGTNVGSCLRCNIRRDCPFFRSILVMRYP